LRRPSLIRIEQRKHRIFFDYTSSGIDLIGNVAVIFAAMGVWGTATAWPDLLVAALMAGLFLSSSFQIIKQAIDERKTITAHSQ